MLSAAAIGRALFWPTGCPQPPVGEDPDQFATKWIKENPNVGVYKTSSRATYIGAGITVVGLLTGISGYFKDNKFLKNFGWGLGALGFIATMVGKMCGFEFDIPKTIKNTIVTGGTCRPQKTPVEVGIEADKVEKADITSHGEKLDGYFIKAKTETKKTLIYVHGVRNNVGDCLEEIKKIRENLNVNILVVDPRGFGNSKLGSSELTAEGLVDDVKAMYEFVEAKYGSENISAFGHSLGGAILVQLAQEKEIDTLILQSTFTKSDEAIASFGNGTLPKFVTDFIAGRSMVPFNSIDSINKVKAKNVVIAHGTTDSTIADKQGKDLFDKLTKFSDTNKKYFELIGATHANYNDYYKDAGVYDVLNEFICDEAVADSKEPVGKI